MVYFLKNSTFLTNSGLKQVTGAKTSFLKWNGLKDAMKSSDIQRELVVEQGCQT